MAQSVRLQAAGSEEIDALRANPAGIGTLTGDDHRTYLGPTLNYFLTGEAYPNPTGHPLGAVLDGAEDIDCPSLENGAFAVVPREQVADIAALLAAVDLAAVRTAVEQADFDTLLDEQELYDLELIPVDEAPGVITTEIKQLAAFYERAAQAGLAMAMYTT
ncbi:DUF1877 family protein [Streptomyces sp. NPDC056534]|uniref:DUF1877 family protein n=1 Tax=Streptomyces sp. NPDC056534 TaxID=3345857 RepID=UPI0036B967C7